MLDKRNFSWRTLSGKLFNSIYVDLNKYYVLSNLVPAINILADFLSQIMFGRNLFICHIYYKFRINTFQHGNTYVNKYRARDNRANSFCQQYKCMRNSTASIHWLTCVSVFFVLLIAFGRFPSTMTTFTQGSYTCMRFISLSNPTKSARLAKLQTNENYNRISVRVWSFVKKLLL